MTTLQKDQACPATALALDAQSFEPYGDVLENKGERRRRDFPASFARDTDAVPALWINRLQAVGWTAQLIDQMECHPHSAQSFLPLHATPYFVAVALAGDDGLPDLKTLRGFVSKGGQGICYRPGVWHYAFTSLDDFNEVAVILSQRPDGGDTIVVKLAEPVRIELLPLAHHPEREKLDERQP